MNSTALTLGILISMLFTEFTGLSPAGLIVPAYLALYIHSPVRIGYTICLALATVALVKLLDRVTIIYGRRKFAAAIIISFALTWVVNSMGFFGYSFNAVGYIIPAIIANEVGKQGIYKTFVSLGIVMCIIILIMLLFGQVKLI